MNGPLGDIQRFAKHDNAFGVIRLVFASLVIVAHTPELIDGNRSREWLTLLFGTMSFGELAVDGFFLVSGYLITGSYLKQPVASSYLLKRIARIYPAYAVCFLICILVVAPLAGASGADIRASLETAVLRMALLRPPVVDDVFAGTPYPALNGSMWTIALEFGCYLLVLLLGRAGVLRHPRLVLAMAIACMVAYELTQQHPIPRLTGLFLCGALFHLWRDRIAYTPPRAAAAFAALLALLFVPALAHPAVAGFGGYVIFALAALGGNTPLARINNRDDISYGVYLYAWPIGKLILWTRPDLHPVAVGLLTLLLSCACGWLSWHLLEKRVMRLCDRWTRPGPGWR